MITEQELNISNKSYTNKDFASIYQEILDLAKKLSDRFDPETSNESDPFIVLMKLLSFMGDKINYNIDKNILERFMPSATQESSMRNLCEMMGYNMHYYIAPETTITIQYVGKENLTETGPFEIPRFTGVSNSNSDSDYKVNFFIKNRNIIISDKNTIYGTTDEQGYYDSGHGNIVVMEGICQDLTILGDTNIHLDNLDSNNRIYFPEKMVAENGIFITGGINKGIENEWIKVSNLNTRDNLFVYKFGYDSLKGLPYIEFPDNISTLIGDGLQIKYTVTSGLSGNINSKVLNCLTESKLNYVNSNDKINIGKKEDGIYPLVITNINAATNGRNPESINEAYNGFKKTIGTFNTLVTCRDYMNYIYNLLDDDEIYSLVSNIMVSDRRTDINYSTPIVTFGAGGQTTITSIKQEGNKDALTAYDLCLYPLQTYKQDNLENFVNSFKPETNQTLIRQKIEDSRCISHDYKKLSGSDIYLIKNYLKLTCRIGTTYKVNASEQAKIIENIQRALAHSYNARNVDYGYEIPYDSLVQTIESADSRIKSVTLYEPDLETKVMFENSNEYTKDNASDTFNTIIAKNIMSGRYQLFDYDTDFDYEYGQQQISIDDTSVDMIYENIKSVDTETELTLSTSVLELKENQQIQIIWPNLITEVIYPYGQSYAANFNCEVTDAYVLKESNSENNNLPDYLAFFWTDTEKNQRYALLGPGDIIKPSFTINKNSGSGSRDYYISSSKISQEDLTILISELGYDQTNEKIKVYSIPSAQDQVEKLYINKEEVTTTCYCYWLLNNSNNSLFNNSSETEYVLDSGEYFYKTDSSFNTLAIYGPGTKIERSSDLTGFGECSIIDISKLSEQGLLGQRDYFKIISCTEENTLTFTENNILTLNVGDKCWVTDNSSSKTIDNTWKSLTNFKYTLKDESDEQSLPSIDGIETPYSIRSRLNINSGPNLGQIINSEDDFEFKDKDGETVLSISGNDYENCYFKLNDLRQLSGGDNTNLAEVNYLVDKSSPERYNLLKLYLYTLSEDAAIYQPDYQGYIRITLESSSSEDSTYELFIPNLNKETLLMIWTDEIGGSTSSNISITEDSGTVVDYFTGDGMSNNLYKGLNIISIKNVNKLTLENSGTNKVSLVISKLSVLNEEVSSAILTKIRALDTKNQFYYNYIPDNSKFIDEQDILDPHAFYDYNNLYNKWTMSEIDFKNSIIEIARGSRA